MTSTLHKLQMQGSFKISYDYVSKLDAIHMLILQKRKDFGMQPLRASFSEIICFSLYFMYYVIPPFFAFVNLQSSNKPNHFIIILFSYFPILLVLFPS